MVYKHEREPMAGAALAWFAGQIPNPVLRLRFLREFSTRPVSQQPCSPLRSLPALVIAVALLSFAPPRFAQSVLKASPAPVISVAAPPRPDAVRISTPPEIWLVEKSPDHETWSNGLRIETRFSTTNHPRSWIAFSAVNPAARGGRRTVPAGIVFHSTESLQAPFEPADNAKLTRIGESLLAYVRRKRAYNYVIDRFGRAWRIVGESDAANHAGNSIWSDRDWLYLNLNESFLAVSFETQTLPGQEQAEVTPAQLHTAAMLTDMLRRRYNIAAADCVTHAQVSVNPSNLHIGWHLDWASSFPFDRLGLPDNYALPLPSVALFGFEYDADFARRAGPRMFREAQLADQQLRDRALAAHVGLAEYRKQLQKMYRADTSHRDPNAAAVDE